MRTVLLVLLFTGVSPAVTAQEFRYGFGYNYTYSPRWDKAIQTYNFSRPDLTEKQPLLMHGGYATATFLFYRLRHVQGISLTYNYARSAAQNTDFKATLGLHMISCGYTWHYERLEYPDHFFFDAGCSLLSGGIFRKVNNEPLVNDDKNIRALGIGGELNVSAGYQVLIVREYALAPFVQVCYAPYYFSPRSEAVLNQTMGLTGAKWTGIFTTRIGISIYLIKFTLRTN